MEKKLIQFFIPEKLKNKLINIACEKGMTLSGLMLYMVNEFLKKES